MSQIKIGDIHYTTYRDGSPLELTVKSIGRKWIHYEENLQTEIDCKSAIFDRGNLDYPIYPPVSISKEVFNTERYREHLATVVKKYIFENNSLTAFSTERLAELERDINSYKQNKQPKI